MSKVMLHIGMPKSGSTFLQNAVERGLVSYRGKRLIAPAVQRMGSNKELSSGHVHLVKSDTLHRLREMDYGEDILFLSMENFCSPDFKLSIQQIIDYMRIDRNDLILLWIQRDPGVVGEKFYNEGLINGLKNEIRKKYQATVIQSKIDSIEKSLLQLSTEMEVIVVKYQFLNENLTNSGFNLKPGIEKLISNVTHHSSAPYELIRLCNVCFGWLPLYRIFLRYKYKHDIHLRLLITSVPTWWKCLWRK